jgi:DNA-binding GntR family transcriptional regulator
MDDLATEDATRLEPTPDGQPYTVDDLYRELRVQILRGRLRPGAVLSQVRLAQEFGVGRTPLREALRMLQREGLVDAAYNRRVRVSQLSTSELEQLYARRILLEALGLRASIPRFTATDLNTLDELKETMESFMPDPSQRLEEWERPHRAFHQLLVRYAGAHILRDIQQLQDHAERYRALFGPNLPASFTTGAAEHAELVAAVRERDQLRAGRVLARHFGRSGLALLSQTAPTHDSIALREALRVVLGDEDVAAD